jgi:hypothetical protein
MPTRLRAQPPALKAERAWLDFADETGKRVELFRLSGIYGPGRSSVIDNLRAGTARRIVKPAGVQPHPCR